ncbi:MAG: hypothetical protein MUO40_07160 [Anaerolineaceae bacterium]|nr:hypothetical protein [Anaerolineaceae bacterium]
MLLHKQPEWRLQTAQQLPLIYTTKVQNNLVLILVGEGLEQQVNTPFRVSQSFTQCGNLA